MITLRSREYYSGFSSPVEERIPGHSDSVPEGVLIIIPSDDSCENVIAQVGYNNDNSRTVNQTNNSPKSLSRLEIYRMTRNALNV